MRTLLVARIVMLLLGLLFPAPLVAQEELRIVLVDRGSPELSRKVRAEAVQAGFAVEEEEREDGQVLAVVTVASSEEVDVTIARRGDEPPFSQKVSRRAGEGESFPLRVIEELRARLIELEIVDESRFGAAPPPPEPEPEPLTPAPAPAPAPKAPESAAPARSELDTLRSDALGTHDRSRLWLRGGMAATVPEGGIGTTPAAALGLGYEASNGLGLGLRALLPLTDNEVSEPEGEAEVSTNLFLGTLDYAPRIKGDWLLGAGLGGGVLLLAMQAQPEATYVGNEDRLASAVVFADASAGYWLADWLRLRATLWGGASAPRPVLRFAGREVAAWGRWFAALSLELEASLPAGGGP